MPLLEGMIIAAPTRSGATRRTSTYRGEYSASARRFGRAVQEARARLAGQNIQGSGFDLDVVIHRGAGAYICGEETALLTSLEGGKGFPKLKPPFPAISGLFQCPTIVNNVETLACVPFILRHGAERFAALGTPRQGGTRLFSVCGHVKRPGSTRPGGRPCGSSSSAMRKGVREAASSRPSSPVASRRRCSPPTRSTSAWTSTPDGGRHDGRLRRRDRDG